MRTYTRNHKYMVSTVKISKHLYETAVFPVKKCKRVFIYFMHEINWEEVEKINYTKWYEKFYYHNLMVKYWSINK